MKWNVGAIILFVFMTSSTLAEASCLRVESDFKCHGVIKVHNSEELGKYLIDYGLKKSKGHHKHEKSAYISNVVLDGEFVSESLNISTPCKVTIAKKSKIEVNGEVCINSGDKIEVENDFYLRSSSFSLEAPGQVKIKDHFDAIVSGNVELISSGDHSGSHVRIGDRTSLKSKNLKLEAFGSVSLGHSSNLQIQKKLQLISNGIEINRNNKHHHHKDKLKMNWASVSHDTKIHAKKVEIISNGGLRISKQVNITSIRLNLDAKVCKVHEKSMFNINEKEGRCFVGERSIASFDVSPDKLEVGEPVLFNAQASTYPEGSMFFWSFDEGVSKVTSLPEASYIYPREGTYTVGLKVVTADKFFSETSKEITVVRSKPLLESIAYFSLQLNDKQDTLKIKNRSSLLPSEIVEGSYIVNGVTFPMPDFFINSPVKIPVVLGDVLNIKQILKDKYGKTFDYEKQIVIDPLLSMQAEFKVEQSGVNSVFFNGLRSYDLFGGASANIDWGDGLSSAADGYFALHEYSEAGTYQVSLTLLKDGADPVSKTVEVVVDGNDPGPLQPVASFEREKPNYAKHVRFYVDQSGTPNGEILSYQWDFGNGEQGTGKDVIAFYDPGVYQVSLQITDSLGLRNTEVQQIVVTDSGAPIIANVKCETEFLFADCEGVVLHKEKLLERVRFRWGDGSDDEFYQVSNPEWERFNKGHLYQNEGTYEVQLRGFTSDGQQVTHHSHSTVSARASQNHPPIASLNCVVDQYTQISCDSFSSFDPDGFIVRKSYLLSDGTRYDDLDFFSHDFGQTGVYGITLEVEDNLGAVSTAQSEVEVFKIVNQPPIASGVCSSNGIRELSCTSFSADPDGQIASVQWILDSGEVLEGDNVTFQNLEERAYSVKLIVTDDEGAMDESNYSSLSIVPAPFPTALLTGLFASYVRDQKVQAFSIGSESGSAENAELAFEWLLDDIQVSESDILEIYPTEGLHSLVLKTTNIWGKSSESHTEFIVGNKPTFDVIKNKQVEMGVTTIHFDLINIIPGESGDTEISWKDNGKDWILGTTSFDVNYSTSGRKVVSVKVENSFGIETIKSFDFIVDPYKFEPILENQTLYVQDGGSLILKNLFIKDVESREVSISLLDGDGNISISGEEIAFSPPVGSSGNRFTYNFSSVSEDVEHTFTLVFEVLKFSMIQEIPINMENIVDNSLTIALKINGSLSDVIMKLNPDETQIPSSLTLYEATMSGDKKVYKFEPLEETEWPIEFHFNSPRFMIGAKTSKKGLSDFTLVNNILSDHMAVCKTNSMIDPDGKFKGLFYDIETSLLPVGYFEELHPELVPLSYRGKLRVFYPKTSSVRQDLFVKRLYEYLRLLDQAPKTDLFISRIANNLIGKIFFINDDFYNLTNTEKNSDEDILGLASAKSPKAVYLNEKILYDDYEGFPVFLHERAHLIQLNHQKCKGLLSDWGSLVDFSLEAGAEKITLFNTDTDNLRVYRNAELKSLGHDNVKGNVHKLYEGGIHIKDENGKSNGMSAYHSHIYLNSSLAWGQMSTAVTIGGSQISEYVRFFNETNYFGIRNYVGRLASTLSLNEFAFPFASENVISDYSKNFEILDEYKSIYLPFLGMAARKIPVPESGLYAIHFPDINGLTLDTVHPLDLGGDNTGLGETISSLQEDLVGGPGGGYKYKGNIYKLYRIPETNVSDISLFFSNIASNGVQFTVNPKRHKLNAKIDYPRFVNGGGQVDIKVKVYDFEETFGETENITVDVEGFNYQEGFFTLSLLTGECGNNLTYPTFRFHILDKFGEAKTFTVEGITILMPACP